MAENTVERVREIVEAVYGADSRCVLATLIRLLGDFDLAEEALHDAFTAAVEQWPRDGVPAKPRAWLVSTGRFRAIDGMRRRARFDASLVELAKQLESDSSGTAESEDQEVEDDRLRLIFTCCLPALPPDAQVALTLREKLRDRQAHIDIARQRLHLDVCRLLLEHLAGHIRVQQRTTGGDRDHSVDDRLAAGLLEEISGGARDDR